MDVQPVADGVGEPAVQSKQACEITAVPAVLQPQQSVVTGEIGTDGRV